MTGTDAKTSFRMDPAAAAAVERAVAEGRHSTTWSTVCDGCGRWVEAIRTIVPGTHKRLCRDCAEPNQQQSDLANAVSRSSRGERNDEPIQTRPVDAALPTGQPYGTAASQAAGHSPAAARPGVDPGPGPTSTVACPLFSEPEVGA